VIALDTNVLLRALVDDETAPEQCAAARRLIESEGAVSIGAVVFVEAMWTLSRSYGYGRMQVARVARLLLEHPKYRVRSADLLAGAVARYERAGIDFADAIALEDARSERTVLHTFDRKLARQDGAQLVAAA